MSQGKSRCGLKKNAQRESCELSFIWGKMRTIGWETTFQVALRNCSKEVGGKVSVIYGFSEGGGRVRAVKHTFWQRVAASHKEQMSLLMILVFF